MLPSIRADTLKYWEADNEELYDITLLAAQDHFKLKKLHLIECPTHTENEYGYTEELTFDWHSLEELMAKCFGENLVSLYNDLITVGSVYLYFHRFYFHF